MNYGTTASANISAYDYELAETALATTDNSTAAIRILRDECGWSLGKAKCVVDLVQIAQKGHLNA